MPKNYFTDVNLEIIYLNNNFFNNADKYEIMGEQF